MKNTMKKIGLLFAVVIMTVLCAVSVSAESYTEGYYTYTVENNEATITAVDVNNISGDIVIPTYLGDYPVTAIGPESFYQGVFITKVTVPEGVTKISRYAFDGCFKLEKIIIPDSVTVIGKGAFYNCFSLKEFVIPEDSSFTDGYKTIEEDAFRCCVSLKEFVIPENVTLTGDFHFLSCYSLENLVIKNPETTIGEHSVYADVSPKDITTEEWVEKYLVAIKAMIGELEDNELSASELMDDWSAHTEFHKSALRVLPDITIHGYANSTAEAYASENGIAFEVIGEAVSTISGQCGDNVYWEFDETTGELVISGEGDMWDYSDDYNTPWHENGYFPYIKSVVVEEGITSLGGGAFSECYRMETVSLPESLKELGLFTFSTCCSLTEIDLPENLEKIGAACFGACYGLKEITIPEKIKEIPDECFSGCFNLKAIVFPDGLEKIGDKAFEGCYDLPELTIGKNVTYLGYRAFRMCAVLKDVYILNPDLDLTTESNYIGKRVLLTDDEYDRVEFFDRYGDVYSELLMYMADDVFDIRHIDALEGEEKVRFESLENEYNELTNKIENLQQHLGSNDNNCVVSDILTIHGYANSTAKAYANENGIKFEVIKENVTVTDNKTNVQINYTDGTFNESIELVVTEDKTTANIALSDEYENFKAYDISLVADGNKVQPGGKVTVKLPLPVGYNADSIAVYYISDSGEKTRLDSKVENGLVVFEIDHFSVYAIVDESSKIETPAEPEKPTEPTPDEPVAPETPDTPDVPEDNNDEPCSCNCHAGGIKAFFFKILNFFQKLFGMNKVCACGAKH